MVDVSPPLRPVTALSPLARNRPVLRDLAAGPGAVRLRLRGGWQLLVDGHRQTVPAGGQRVLALLALDGPLPRSRVAGTLWPECTEANALGNLRSALSRLRRLPVPVVHADRTLLSLDTAVTLDVRELEQTARALVADPAEAVPEAVHDLVGCELLAGWYDDWVAPRREHLRQLVLHALEAVSEQWCSEHRYAEALECALAALHSEPLRESAHRAVIRVHLAEGNHAEVLRQFERYRRALHDELGVPPSHRMTSLVADILPTQRD